jgi:Raf kinase inhibitor-like YbhB/YbcL family protein
MRMPGFAIFLAALLLGSSASALAFELASPQLADGGTIAREQVHGGAGCAGGNVSPALAWKDAPPGTKSFAVTVFDPDAPTGRGWWHWVIFDIPAAATGLPRDAGNAKAKLAPEGSVQSVNDFGETGYAGPCPPPGDRPHRYVFTVYALKVARLRAPGHSPGGAVASRIEAEAIGRAAITARYGR